MSFSDALLVLVFVLVPFVPGSIVGLTAGLGRWTAVSAAPLVTHGLTAVTEQVCVAVRLLIRADPASRGHGLQHRSGPRSGSRHAIAVEGTRREGSDFRRIWATGALDTINQDWDASFHANATRFILDTGNADPRALSALYPQE